MKLDMIMVNEVNEEIKIDSFVLGDELDDDYISLWKEMKINKAKERFPEAHRFYFEKPFSSYSYHELWDYAMEND